MQPLLKYDTIIFDLDFTIWNGCEPKYWAKLLIPPFKLNGRCIYGTDGKFIQFQDNIEDVLRMLHSANKNVGFASIGALENVLYNMQPSIVALQMFNIYQYFNYQTIMVFKTYRKAIALKPKGNTLFIDDDDNQLMDAKQTHGDNITVLDRKSFHSWKDLL
jgi:predicted phosphatase